MKLLTKEICPKCKHDFESEKDLENFDLKKNVGTIKELKDDPIKTPDMPEVKEVIKEVVKIPSHIPKFKCKDGNCGLMHDNKNYTSKIKGKCTNCGQFTGDINSECPFCNQKEFDELDEDELNDLGIPEPKGGTHDHESE